jgi:ribosomal protein L10
MVHKYFKKYKLNQLQIIKQTYKYIYIFRYNDLTINENIFLKKKLKELNFKSLVLKQNLTNKIFSNTKGQGSILIIYGNENINIIENLSNLKKIELIFLIVDKNIFSNLKLKKIFSKINNFPLNFVLIKPIFNFLYYLKKI